MADPQFDQFLAGLGNESKSFPPSLYVRRRRKPSIWVRLVPLWVVLGLGLVMVLAIGKLQTPEGRTVIPSIAQPAWQQSVVNYIKKHDPLLSIDKVYKPEPLRNATIYLSSDNIWFDLTGEYAGISVDSKYNPGTGGYCDATCKFGVRVEYKVDEGFDRVGSEDRVFFLKRDYTVTGYAPTDIIRFRGVNTGDGAQKEMRDFLSGQMAH